MKILRNIAIALATLVFVSMFASSDWQYHVIAMVMVACLAFQAVILDTFRR